jgi:hypothetical protein
VLADSHTILNNWKSYFCMQVKVHAAEQLVPGLSSFEFEIAIAKLKKYTSPGRDQIPLELIQAEDEILLFGIRKNCHISGRSQIHKKENKNNCYELHTNFIPYSSLKIKPIHRLNC